MRVTMTAGPFEIDEKNNETVFKAAELQPPKEEAVDVQPPASKE